MITPAGQPRSGTLRSVSSHSKNAGGSSAQPTQSMRGWRVGRSRIDKKAGSPSRQAQTVKGWPRTRSVNKKGR